MSAAAVLALVTGFVGLVVLAVMSVTLFGQVKSLGRTVARSSDRLDAAGSPPSKPRESVGPDQTNDE